MEHSIVHLKRRRGFHGVKSLGRTVSFQDEKRKHVTAPVFPPGKTV